MHNKKHNDEYIDRKTAAKYTGFSPGTLAVWDCTKRYNLKPIKIGRSVRYRKKYLDEFLESRLIKY
ncbi:helix-turn-helix transcriptional regulator [Mucilaginibacter psychrotolerans]|uniref:DNA-binding protein n=1 Tax=Mucilaginibacter psychrotolerans TaxID=1524096 RepID=A0A4Y8SBB8_9SPHI|nr:helix-turn-helix domain-containing protein [Mucilaginibacter psychrotolerans]TFF36182.1 DNA-binding protein [Mucilaginibacter psychrotolerans]